MTNIDFNLGFVISRESLDRFINQHTSFHSMLETSFGQMGVNIKIPFEHKNSSIMTITYNMKTSEWETGEISYNQYLNILPYKDRQKELRKQRNNTFLVFYSGTAIMSGMSVEYMKDVYYKFVNIITSSKNDIEEKLIVD
jgi:hypothetical protein